MTVRKNAFVLRSLFGAFLGAAVVAAAVVGIMGYAIFTTSDVAKMVLNELAVFLESIYIVGADELFLDGLKDVVEEVAEIALVLFGMWYAVPLFAKAILAHMALAIIGWSSLWSYLAVGYLVGSLMGARSLLTSEIQQVVEQDNEVLFTAFALDGPALAATLGIIWLWCYEKKADSSETALL